jgi:molybdopterin-biosynthesis enzyme MoeA-like protein
MPADSSASKEVGTAALLVIGGKILSGRTKDQNIGYIAEYLTAVGIDLKEVRVVGDEERAIADALNALRHRYTYVFTTGGIGPTHSDITADCVAKAFGVPIDTDPRALAILHEWVKTTGAEMNKARLRLTGIPKGADLILNKVAGVPSIHLGDDRRGGRPSSRPAFARRNRARGCTRGRHRHATRRDRQGQS